MNNFEKIMQSKDSEEIEKIFYDDFLRFYDDENNYEEDEDINDAFYDWVDRHITNIDNISDMTEFLIAYCDCDKCIYVDSCFGGKKCEYGHRKWLEKDTVYDSI